MYYKLIREHIDGKAVRGHLYSVEHRFSRSAGIYKEYLTPIAPTLENADCLIPALIYKVQVTRSPKFRKLLPILLQVPNRSGIRIIGVHSVNQRSVCDGESGANPSTFSQTAFELVYEDLARDDEHSKGCILIPDATICDQLTNTLLNEQQHNEPIYIELCDKPSPLSNPIRISANA